MSAWTPQAVFSGLEPAIVWQHFALLCDIPRASKQEERLRQHLLAWAAQRGLPALVDAAGNLIVRKPASPGREHLPGVVLQAHLDMVCQNNADTPHDFSRDPIRPVQRDGWLVAEGTTLGADNGIGVAAALAGRALRAKATPEMKQVVGRILDYASRFPLREMAVMLVADLHRGVGNAVFSVPEFGPWAATVADVMLYE